MTRNDKKFLQLKIKGIDLTSSAQFFDELKPLVATRDSLDF